MPNPPQRHIEVEVTCDVDEHTTHPSWESAGLVVGPAQPRELDARYLDTATLTLALAGYALRRRTGGGDPGWHLKGPRTGNARVELGWPLDAGPVPAPELAGPELAVPAAVLSELSALLKVGITEQDLVPLARVRNQRTAFTLSTPDGTPVAEFVDDRVRTLDERTGTARAWREWELELVPNLPPAIGTDILATATAAAYRAGARPAQSESKLARALGR